MNFFRRSTRDPSVRVEWTPRIHLSQKTGLTFCDGRKIVLASVALYVTRELHARFQPCVQDVRLVQQEYELDRAEQFTRANGLPEVERVQLRRDVY